MHSNTGGASSAWQPRELTTSGTLGRRHICPASGWANTLTQGYIALFLSSSVSRKKSQMSLSFFTDSFTVIIMQDELVSDGPSSASCRQAKKAGMCFSCGSINLCTVSSCRSETDSSCRGPLVLWNESVERFVADRDHLGAYALLPRELTCAPNVRDVLYHERFGKRGR